MFKYPTKSSHLSFRDRVQFKAPRLLVTCQRPCLDVANCITRRSVRVITFGHIHCEQTRLSAKVVRTVKRRTNTPAVLDEYLKHLRMLHNYGVSTNELPPIFRSPRLMRLARVHFSWPIGRRTADSLANGFPTSSQAGPATEETLVNQSWRIVVSLLREDET